MLCPICENESEKTQQCTNCGWQFVYFTQEPTEQEQNEYTLLLQNYRTEFYFNLAKQYYQNKQYEETIQCCFISCEHQSYENPLSLLALTYQEVNNTDEAVKYANMVLKINPNNESAKVVLKELTIKPKEEKYENLIFANILTDKVLTPNNFEKTLDFEKRINKIKFFRIGIIYANEITPSNYHADSEMLDLWIDCFRSRNFAMYNTQYLYDHIMCKVSPQHIKNFISSDIHIVAEIRIDTSNKSIIIENLHMVSTGNEHHIYNLMYLVDKSKREVKERIQNIKKAEEKAEKERQSLKYDSLPLWKKLITNKSSV